MISRPRWLADISVLVAAAFAAAVGAAPLHAQAGHSPALTTPLPHADAIASWIALDAAPGREQSATRAIMDAMPGWQLDALGNLVMRRGSGRPLRVVACGLDQPGYVVSRITADGYLRLHQAVRARRNPLWDQFHEGQRVRILTARGEVPGVVGIPSVHLQRGGTPDTTLASAENFWVDVGAHDSAEVASLGIALLDPVSRDWPTWEYADVVAGPAAAARAGCAAVAAAAHGTPAHGETIFVLSVQSAFRWDGLSAAVASLHDVDTLVIAAPLRARRRAGARAGSSTARAADDSMPVITTIPPRPPFGELSGTHIGTTVALRVRTAFPGTLAESIHEPDAAAYFRAVASAAGVSTPRGGPTPVTLTNAASTAALATVHVVRGAASNTGVAAADSLISTFTNTYAVSGHEASMRAAIFRALPSWARSKARVDSAGSIILAMGPDRDTAVVIAHMDEVGWAVSGITPDGTVQLRSRGGFFHSLWEGQTALLHFDRDSLRDHNDGPSAPPALAGVFVPRTRATRKQPPVMTAWFGMDSAALVARGVHVGQAVTSFKRATRLAGTRFTNRAIDDRAGCTALILALRAIDPSALRHKVIFVWSIGEETGLFGATAFANEHGRSVHRVYTIDTFVSSESPIDPHHFAYTPLGEGPVARMLDNSSVTPPDEMAQLVRVAKGAGIPLQIGTTNGGNDGSAFVRYGVIDVPIGWPLRYSHSPAEVADLSDIASLGRLIAAVVMK